MKKGFLNCWIKFILCSVVMAIVGAAPMLLCARAESELRLHVLDVGQADAIFVECDGKYMLIDGGNVADSQLIFSFLRNTLQISHIDYVIATHPHEDHIGGLAAALNACSVGKIYSSVTTYDSDAFRSFVQIPGR